VKKQDEKKDVDASFFRKRGLKVIKQKLDKTKTSKT